MKNLDAEEARHLIKGLTKRQQEILGLIAINEDRAHNPRTLEALEKKGLIRHYEEEMLGRGNTPIDRIPMRVRRYYLPLPVHIAWCKECSEELARLREDG